FMQHNYCGTFFIEHNAENSYISEEAALEAFNREDTSLAEDIIVTVLMAVLLVCIFLALRNGDKKVIFSRRTSRLFLIAGIAYALGNIWSEYKGYIGWAHYKDHYIGILSTLKYYCQLYNVLAIPAIIFCCGLVLRQHECKIYGQSIKRNSIALRTAATAVPAAASCFILYRFGVRAYELVMILSGKNISVRLPFYSLLLELPYELAKTDSNYTNLIAFRFLKDLPVFAASAFTVIMFSMVLFSAAKGEINTVTNRKRLTVSIAALVISSLLFNVLGLFEVNMLNNGFTGIYGNVVYTIGIRSNCEPMLYAVVLWFFSVYIRCVPQSPEITA
ncbi:MAG: hypothetical protein J1F11_08435, partial [Oscillospiraceae bacterium]|nr:hypothetical protein [Oscillospiraceae bacterium]